MVTVQIHTLGVSSVTETKPILVQNHVLEPSVVVESPTERESSDGPQLIGTRAEDSALQDASTVTEPLKPNSLQLNKVENPCAKGGISNRTISWKRKIKTTFPLILAKKFDHSRLAEDNDILIEEDSDFEEIHTPETKQAANSQLSLQGEEEEQPTVATFARYRPHGILATLSTSSLCPQKPPSYTTHSLEKPTKSTATSLEKTPNATIPSLEKTPSYTTPSLEKTPSYTTPSLEKTPNYTTPSLEKTPNYTTPSLEKTPNYTTPSLEKTPSYTTPSLEKTPSYTTPSLEKTLNYTTPSLEKTPSYTTPSLEKTPSYTTLSLEKTPSYTTPSLEKTPSYTTPSLEKTPSYTTPSLEKTPSYTTPSLENPTNCTTQTSLTPKKKLILSSTEKNRLLNWDLATPGKFSAESAATDEAAGNSQRSPTAENNTDPQNDAVTLLEPASITPEPTRNSLLSGFQQWASTLRRSLPGSGNNSLSIKRNRPLRARPLSEGSLSFSSVFTAVSQNQEEDEGRRSRADTDGSKLSAKRRSEITTMLEQVTLGSKPPGRFKDDMASLQRRKINFFSSLRLKRNERKDQNKADDQTKDILAILSQFRTKASTQQQHKQEEEDCSSDDEDLELDSRRSDVDNSEREKNKQERMLIQQTKREQLKRLHRAQVIQRQLEEVGEKQRALEEKGVALEKFLRGESEEPSEDESGPQQTWFNMVLEKNRLARYESELIIFAQELELEDRQSQLQQELRGRISVKDCEKSAGELMEEQALLVEVMKVVEERDRLVSLLEEQRLQERAEDRDLESLILSKGYEFHWA